MKENRNIMINKAGGTAGKNSVNYRISLPAYMVKELGITKDDRSVTLKLENKKIIIEKGE
ncbi:MAG: AbrB/MazE/SpoVT family DNA-binding domain-containing protein [Paraclostridium sordellii]